MRLSLRFASLVLLGLGTFCSAQEPMDMSNNMKRDSIVAAVGEISEVGYTPRMSSRSLFEKRETCSLTSPNICTRSGNTIRCCPEDYDCFYSAGDWRCDPNVLGLSRGQKIGIGIGVTVAFFLICIIALVIFCCCCRKAAKIAQAAVNNHNNNNNGAHQQTGVYAPYDPANIPLQQQQPMGHGGEVKTYPEHAGYYHPQQAYDPYPQQHQQQYTPGATQPYQAAPTPAPPYQPNTGTQQYQTPPPPTGNPPY